MTWTAEIETKTAIVDSNKRGPNGKPQKMKVTHTAVVLSRGPNAIRFGVTRRKDKHDDQKVYVTFSDIREECTGHAQQYTGQFGGPEYCKSGRKKMMSPTAWLTEVTRLIGEARAKEIIAQVS